MIRAEVERLQRELGELAGLTGVEGIRAASRLREDMVRSIQRARALMAADLHFLEGWTTRRIAGEISDGETGISQYGVVKWIKRQIGQDPLMYVGVWRDSEGFHVTAVPAESREQVQEVLDGGMLLAPAVWDLRVDEVDAEDVWRRITRLEGRR